MGRTVTKRYFIRTNLYKFLTENGDMERAVSNSENSVNFAKNHQRI